MTSFIAAFLARPHLDRFTLLVADSWSWKGLISGLNTQEGVIRLCIVAVALGLFILLKK